MTLHVLFSIIPHLFTWVCLSEDWADGVDGCFEEEWETAWRRHIMHGSWMHAQIHAAAVMTIYTLEFYSIFQFHCCTCLDWQGCYREGHLDQLCMWWNQVTYKDLACSVILLMAAYPGWSAVDWGEGSCGSRELVPGNSPLNFYSKFEN